MSLEYSNTVALAPSNPSAWLFTCLSLTGFNHMQVALSFVPGTYNSPGIYPQGRNKDGFVSEASGKMGIGLEGYRSHLFQTNSLSLYDYFGNGTELKGTQTQQRTLLLPDVSGSLLASSGYATYANSSVTTLLDTTGKYGSLKMYDKLGGSVEVVYGGSATPTLLSATSTYSLTASPTASNVGVSLTGANLLQITMGSAGGRDMRIVSL